MRLAVLVSLSACATLKPQPGDSDEVPGEVSGLRINEFLAFGVEGGYAEGADWLEIYNTAGVTADLTRVSLWADDGTDQLPWAFPAGTELAANGFLVVICDATNQSGETPHASFRIGRKDGTLYLGTIDGDPLDILEYSNQTAGLSSARFPDGGDTWRTGVAPTPGTSNGE